MVNQQLVDYVRSVKQQGHEDEKIKAHLANNGYQQDHIEEVFQHISNTNANNVPTSPPVKPVPNKEKKGFPFFLIVIPLFLLLVAVVLFLMFSYKEPESCPSILIGVHEMDGDDFICTFDGKLQIAFENKGIEPIMAAKVEIIGDKGKYLDELSNLDLVPGDIFPRIIVYNDLGNIKKVNIYSGVQQEGEVNYCRSNKLTYTDIRDC